MSDIEKKKPVIFVVAAALVNDSGRVMLARRPIGKSMGGLWEFPGGKVSAGETPEEALVRELREELDILIEEADLEPAGFTSHAYEDFHLFMPLFICRKWKGSLKALEHDSIEWSDTNNITSYKMPGADIPLIPQLLRCLG